MNRRDLNGELVLETIRTIDNPNGSTITYLKIYIAAKYSINVVEVKTFLSKYLKEAVDDGTLIQVPDKGFLSSFKLAPPKDVSVNPVQKDNSETREQKVDKYLSEEQTNVDTKRSSQQLDVEEQPESEMIRIESQGTTKSNDKEKATARVPFTMRTRSKTKVDAKRQLDVEEEPESKMIRIENEVNPGAVTQVKVVKRVRFTTSTKGINDPDVSKQQHESTNINFKVFEAVGILGKENGCSLRAIKKYVQENCSVTANDIATINGVVRSAVVSGIILGTKGTDLRGSFKLARNFV